MDLVPSHFCDSLEIIKAPLSYMISKNVQSAHVGAQVANRINGES